MLLDLVTLLPDVWLACSLLFCCWDRKPDKKQLKERKLAVTRGLRIPLAMAWEAWARNHETAGHTVPTVKE